MISKAFALTMAIFASAIFAESSTAQIVAVDSPTATAESLAEQRSTAEILEDLQAQHSSSDDIFVHMQELNFLIRPGGGGSCASAGGMIVLQACRSILGLEPIEHPYRHALASMRDQDELLNGRVTNVQFRKLLEFYAKELRGSELKVEVLSAPNSPHATDNNVWTDTEPFLIRMCPDQLTVLSYTVTRPDNEVLGRHFVILKDIVGGELHVVDPAAPTKPRVFQIEEDPTESGRYYLRVPERFPAPPSTNELNTIFTVKLTRLGTVRPDALGVESVKRQMSATAVRLSAQRKLRSPTAWRSETASFGLPGLDLPKELGGSEWPATKMIEVFRHAGRHDLNLRDVVGGAHARVLAKSDNPEVRDIVRQVASGKAYLAITLTEPKYGTDYTGMQTASRKVDGGYILNGQKRYNARLDQASHVIVFAKSVTGTEGRLSVYVMPIDTPGLEIETFGAHGLTGNSYGGIKLNDVFVPDSHMIGEDDGGYEIFKNHFTYWRLMQVSAAIGTAEKALEMLAERLRTREVYGAPIGRFTHLQQPLGQYTTQLKAAYALTVEAAELLDEGRYEEAEPLVCGLKAEGIETALAAVDSAARAFGGEGYSDRVDIGDRLRDLNGLRIADGTTDAMRSAVVAQTYGSDLWEMAFGDPDANREPAE